jgi:flagellar hook-basal body complex protein FliE
MSIDALIGKAVGAIASPDGAAAGASTASAGFADSLGRLLAATSDSDATANTAVGQMMDGSGDVHEAMIALQQADLMLQLTVQVRNKLVQAYQDIMRMPV